MTIKAIKEGNIVEYHILEINSWNDFESLAKYLIKWHDAIPTDKVDGISTRTWKFTIQNEVIILKHNDDIGNYFYFERENSKIAPTIINDLNERLG